MVRLFLKIFYLSLNMVLFEGEGRNTQIRDFTGIFLSTSVFCFISMITRQYQWICCTGIVFLVIALMSILASQIHVAPITYSSLIAEIIFAVMALVSSFLFTSGIFLPSRPLRNLSREILGGKIRLIPR